MYAVEPKYKCIIHRKENTNTNKNQLAETNIYLCLYLYIFVFLYLFVCNRRSPVYVASVSSIHAALAIWILNTVFTAAFDTYWLASKIQVTLGPGKHLSDVGNQNQKHNSKTSKSRGEKNITLLDFLQDKHRCAEPKPKITFRPRLLLICWMDDFLSCSSSSFCPTPSFLLCQG